MIERGNYTDPIREDDDLYTVEEFRQMVEDGGFVDDDGFGYAVKNGLADKPTGDFMPIYPSELERIPRDATHVVWYNN